MDASGPDPFLQLPKGPSAAETSAKYAVWAFMSVMLVCLCGAIPMAIWTGNTLYLFGLFAMVFFAI